MPDEPIISDEPEDDFIEIDLADASDDYDPSEDETLTSSGIVEPPVSQLNLTHEQLRHIYRHNVMSMDRLFDQPPVDWFIDGMVPDAPRTILSGVGGSYKSFLALDWFLCAASRRSWLGRDVKPGRVLYMAGEGARGLPKRIEAWCAHNNRDRNAIDMRFMGEPFDLFTMSPEAIEVWRAFLAWLRPRYLVIDTLHTASTADENSNTDMGKVLRNASRIAGGNDGTRLFFIHHKPKEGTTPRGASSLRDDCDVSLSLSKLSGKGRDFIGKLEPDKIRDAEPFRPLYIRFDQHGEGRFGSLYIVEAKERLEDLEGDTGEDDDSTRAPTAIERCMKAIVDHDINYHINGARTIKGMLFDLDLGLDFSKSTVGDAINRLRGAEQQVQDMMRHMEAEAPDASSD